jgi:hypothetical protein
VWSRDTTKNTKIENQEQKKKVKWSEESITLIREVSFKYKLLLTLLLFILRLITHKKLTNHSCATGSGQVVTPLLLDPRVPRRVNQVAPSTSNVSNSNWFCIETFWHNIIRNLWIRPKLGRSCRCICMLGHDYESVVESVSFIARYHLCWEIFQCIALLRYFIYLILKP